MPIQGSEAVLAQYGITTEAALTYLHVLTDDGVMLQKMAAVRKMYEGKVLAGFAGATADAFNLFDKFEMKLQEYNGDRLRVAFDMHNAERVWLFDDDGRYVCHADWNGNRIDYMPVSVIEQAKEKRVAGQIKRLDNKQSILAAARPARVLEHQSRMNLGGRTLDMQALQQQAQLAMAKMQPRAGEVEPPKAKVAAFRPSEPPPDGWVRPATPQARAAEFARLSALPPESWTAEQAKFMVTPQVQQEAAALERMRQMYG